MKYGAMVGDGEVLRLSRCLQRCRDHGATKAAAEMARVAAMFPACPHHGALADPIIAITSSDQIAIICPWCSDPAVLAAWEAEGRVGQA